MAAVLLAGIRDVADGDSRHVAHPAEVVVIGAAVHGAAVVPHDELIAHTTQRQFVYTHRWRPNELVMWDNRCTMHRGTDYDDLRWVRDMARVTISDVANSCEQEGVQVAA